MQEFFCAVYICNVVKQVKEQTVKMLNAIERVSTYSLSVVLLFVCDMLKNVSEKEYVLNECVEKFWPLKEWHHGGKDNMGHLYLLCLNEAHSTGSCNVTLQTVRRCMLHNSGRSNNCLISWDCPWHRYFVWVSCDSQIPAN